MTRMAMERLARSTEADLLDARRYRSDLVVAAQGLTLAVRHDPDVTRCGEAGCCLSEVDPTGQLCAVAHRLAALDHTSSDVGRTVLGLDAALGRFIDALAASFVPVRACRQTAHPSGWCWFTATPGGDGCGEVLQLAHRLSG